MIFDEKYVLTRINRSKETLNEVKLMFENGYYLTVKQAVLCYILFSVCIFSKG